MLEAHRHYSKGQDWHVQLEVAKRPTRFATVVVYSQRCSATGFLTGGRVRPDGTFMLSGELPDGRGTWSAGGQFTGPVVASGRWSVTTADCTDGGDFTAQDANGHFLIGNPFEYPSAGIRRHPRLRQITQAFRRAAPRFTPARARALGYSFAGAPACPAMVHARRKGTAMWGKVLDPRAPQSLMYWCGADGRYKLAGAMFRADGRTRPGTFGRLIRWHKHGGKRTSHWMTHLWLVPDLRDAWATCSPFRAYEAAGLFAYEPFAWIPETRPCTDTVGFDPSA